LLTGEAAVGAQFTAAPVAAIGGVAVVSDRVAALVGDTALAARKRLRFTKVGWVTDPSYLLTKFLLTPESKYSLKN